MRVLAGAVRRVSLRAWWRVIRDTYDGMSRIEDQLRASVPPEGQARPPLAVVRQFRRGKAHT